MVGLWVTGGCALVKGGEGKVNTYLFGTVGGKECAFLFIVRFHLENEEGKRTASNRGLMFGFLWLHI